MSVQQTDFCMFGLTLIADDAVFERIIQHLESSSTLAQQDRTAIALVSRTVLYMAAHRARVLNHLQGT